MNTLNFFFSSFDRSLISISITMFTIVSFLKVGEEYKYMEPIFHAFEAGYFGGLKNCNGREELRKAYKLGEKLRNKLYRFCSKEKHHLVLEGGRTSFCNLVPIETNNEGRIRKDKAKKFKGFDSFYEDKWCKLCLANLSTRIEVIE